MAFKNSIIVTVIAVGIIVLLSAMTAWMFVRSNNKLSKFLYGVLILTMLIPFQTIMMPLMQEMNQFGKFFGIPFKDSLGGLIFMYVGFGAAWVCSYFMDLSNPPFGILRRSRNY